MHTVQVIALKVCNLVEENGRININLENESRILNKLNNTNHVIRLLRLVQLSIEVVLALC